MKYKFLNNSDLIIDKDEYLHRTSKLWKPLKGWARYQYNKKYFIDSFKEVKEIRRPIKKKNIG